MEKEKSFKIIAIVGLVVAVVGLAVGFAAFSATLTINSFEATAKAGSGEEQFASKVSFDNDAACTPTGSATAVAGSATDHTWSGISATFTKPGETVTCEATVKNESAYTAYLNKISTEDVIKCTGSAQNLDAVCSNMSMVISSGDDEATLSTTAKANNAAITGNTIAPTTGTKKVKFVLTYAADGAIPDADVTVSIPTIDFLYDTAD